MFPRALLISILIACSTVAGQAPAQQPIDPAVAKLGRSSRSLPLTCAAWGVRQRSPAVTMLLIWRKTFSS
jgi:hypothetical protein